MGAFRFCPRPIAERIVQSIAQTMMEELSTLNGVIGGEEEVCGNVCAAIKLPSGITLIGQKPTHYERILFKGEIHRLGLKEAHVKVCLDYVTRFQHAHMAVGFDTIKASDQRRKFFHPQHRNLAQECESFSKELKAVVARVFTPELGWKVLDVGAYLGHGSLWMSKQLGSSGRVISIEASEENSAFVRKHRQLNNCKNWSHRRAAIWHTSGEEITLRRTSRQANAIDPSVVKGGGAEIVRTTSLSELVNEMEGTVDLLSLTVNGAEVEALEGMSDLKPPQLPRRVLAPGWYLKENEPRAKMIVPLLRGHGYEVAKTPGNLVFAWR